MLVDVGEGEEKATSTLLEQPSGCKSTPLQPLAKSKSCTPTGMAAFKGRSGCAAHICQKQVRHIYAKTYIYERRGGGEASLSNPQPATAPDGEEGGRRTEGEGGSAAAAEQARFSSVE